MLLVYCRQKCPAAISTGGVGVEYFVARARDKARLPALNLCSDQQTTPASSLSVDMARIKQKTASVVDFVSPTCLESYLARFLARSPAAADNPRSLRLQADGPFAFAATPVLFKDPRRHRSLRNTSVSRRHRSRALEFAAEGQQPSGRSWALVLSDPAATTA